MTEWPKYESHKIDAAGEVISVEVVLPDGNKEWFQATVPAMTAKANIGDWAMLYPDGFKSVSPAKAFEEGYTKCGPTNA
jgi:hypothetical protein